MSTTRQPPLSCFDSPKSQCEHLDKCRLRRRNEHIKLWRRRGLDPFQPLHTAAAVQLRRGIGDSAVPQHTLARGEVGGGRGYSAINCSNQLTGVILNNPFRGSARIVSAVSTMRPALISMLTQVQTYNMILAV